MIPHLPQRQAPTGPRRRPVCPWSPTPLLALCLTIGALPACSTASTGSGGSSAHSTKIVFARDAGENGLGLRGTRTFNLFVLRHDGHVDQITNEQSVGLRGYAAPQWSPDGSRIAAVHHEGSTASLVVMNADGSNERRLRVQESHPSTIAWSPDGRRLAYDGSDVPGVKTIDADGGNDRVISHTKHISQTTGVSWSPDGHSLAFGYVPDPSNRAIRRLAIVKVDGSGFRDVTLGTFDSAVRPVWSPDATILAVVANSGLRSAVEACGADIFLVDVVGKEPPRILPKFGCEAYAPSWSGDGSNIAFSARASDGSGSAIYVIDVQTLTARRLIANGTDPSYFGNGVPAPELAANTPEEAALCVFHNYVDGDRDGVRQCSTGARVVVELFDRFQPNGVTQEELSRWVLDRCESTTAIPGDGADGYFDCTFIAPADVGRDLQADRIYAFVWEIIGGEGGYYFAGFQYD